ncbi:methyltransferase [Durotheca rogersii]|uniref:methyltransferase n=1 Tax=Durotheca rogersii TaxID=419775 RepID=UPI00221EE62C|nr:methyltransferase [Durotheca rogersii]KAI5862861.1 methyltransferase [Durotheca rogersii]
MNIDWLLDGGYLPHAVIRVGIRRQLAQRLAEIAPAASARAGASPREAAYERKAAFVAGLRARPVAEHTAAANAQHYEVAAGALRGMLGPRMKYSCCLYSGVGEDSLERAEAAMLRLYVERAGLRDGMRILDLGCGWGSAALYLAAAFPRSQITAFSNSRSQKAHIDAEAAAAGLANVTVVTGDVVDYEFEPESFDRVVSIELFEHMKNYELLMAKIARALKPGGELFVHIFAHKDTPYDYEEGWMTTHFFTGGTMPSADLLLYFQRDLRIKQQWWVNGNHYSKTCEHWLSNLIANKKQIWPYLVETYGEQDASVWYNRWQVFYMACSELFAYEGGDTWGVAHYLFEKPKSSTETVKQ